MYQSLVRVFSPLLSPLRSASVCIIINLLVILGDDDDFNTRYSISIHRSAFYCCKCESLRIYKGDVLTGWSYLALLCKCMMMIKVSLARWLT